LCNLPSERDHTKAPREMSLMNSQAHRYELQALLRRLVAAVGQRQGVAFMFAMCVMQALCRHRAVTLKRGVAAPRLFRASMLDASLLKIMR
jgi:hypothetical protein